MKVVIVEDEQLSAKRLAKIVTEIDQDIEVIAILESVTQAKKWFNEHANPDLIFLDIELNDGTGFEIIKELNHYPRIIFTTAYEQYALNAFKFNSLDYLLKPIDPQEISKALLKLKALTKADDESYKETLEVFKDQFGARFRERFLIKVGNQFKSIAITEISYFYYSDGISYVKTKAQALPCDFTLDQLMDQLDPKLFFRVNRQCIVGFPAIKEIHSYFNSRLLLQLVPSFTEDVIVSRERVQMFKIWAGM
ncbi:MAG: two-component system response regulator LytT [Roseivirga sp.]|jgi:two-component system response regulator LytT